MERLVVGVCAVTTVLVLLAAAAGHLARPAALRDALAAHGLLPAGLRVPAAAVVTLLEAALGVTGAVALVLGSGLGAVLAASALLFAAYAAYTGWALASGRAGACGCGGRHEVPLSRWVVARAAVLGLTAATGLALPGPLTATLRAPVEVAVVLVAAATFTVLLRHLPVAMHVPEGVPA